MLVALQRSQGPGALPAYIPWVHGPKQDKVFLCDVMLEGLARQMRLFGIDTTSSPQLKKNQRALGIRYVGPTWICPVLLAKDTHLLTCLDDAGDCIAVRETGRLFPYGEWS